jgi:membrane protease subunit HflK
MQEKVNFSIEQSLNTIVRYTRWIAIVIISGILLSGVAFIQPGEVAIVFRFGKLVGNTYVDQVRQPGLHIMLPYLVDKVVRIPVRKIQEVKIDGMYTDSYFTDVTTTGYALTGDTNIVVLDAVLKYKVIDPLKYVLEVTEPEKVLKELTLCALTREISSFLVDDVLTKQKKELASYVLANAQERADKLSLGVQLIALEFNRLQPPQEVKAEFDLVTSTYVHKETMIQEAKSYQEKIIPEAVAESDSMIQKARSYKAERIAQAKSDVAQFYGVIKEYQKNPLIVHERLYREKVESIMRKVANKVLIPKGENGENIILP